MGKAEDFPITEAQLTGNFCETLAYGIYLVTCISCGKVLLTIGKEERWRKAHEIRWVMLSVAFLLFCICTVDTANGLYHNIRAFVEYEGPGGAAADLVDIRDWVNIWRSVDQVVVMILGDFVLIYRCWIVYSKRWIVVAPSFILYLGGIAMAIKLIHVEATLGNRKVTLNSKVIQPWWSAFFAITMAQNVTTTGLLVWRIWKVEKDNSQFRSGSTRTTTPTSQAGLRRVIRVIAESGAAYTLLVFMTFVVSICESNALYPLSDATLIATGICFNVIIARCTPRRDVQFTEYDTHLRTHAEQGTKLEPVRFVVQETVQSDTTATSQAAPNESKLVFSELRSTASSLSNPGEQKGWAAS